jgi:outer membrane protein TolC
MVDEPMMLSPALLALVCTVYTVCGCAGFYVGTGPENAPAPLRSALETETETGVLSVQEAADLAIRNSYAIRAEYSSLELREGAWRLGLRAYLPGIRISAGSDERLITNGSDTFTKSLSISLEQTVWDGGRVGASRALESADIALARSELDRSAGETGEAAVSAYRSVVAARIRLGIKKTSFESASAEREILVAELRLGMALGSDLVTVDLGIAGMGIEIAESELAVAIAESELAEALGMESLPELTERLERGRPVLGISGDRAAELAAARSPDVVLARHSLYKARAQSRIAQFAWLPSIAFNANGYASGDSFPLTKASWTVGLTVDFSSPLLSGGLGATAGKALPFDSTATTSLRMEPFPNPAGAMAARNAALALDLEEERYLATVSGARRSARIAVAEYEKATRKRDICVKALALSETRLALASLRSGLGQSLRTETLEAEMDRATKEVDLVDAALAMVSAEREIEKQLDIPPGALEEFCYADERNDEREVPAAGSSS